LFFGHLDRRFDWHLFSFLRNSVLLQIKKLITAVIFINNGINILDLIAKSFENNSLIW